MKKERPDSFDASNNGIGVTKSLIDGSGNVTDGDVAKSNYDKIFGKWWEKTEFWTPDTHYGWTNSTTGVNGEAPDNLIAEIDREYWNVHLNYDWSKLEKPCIRVTAADDPISQSLDLQIGYLSSWTEDDLNEEVQGKLKLEEYIEKQTSKDPNFKMTEQEKQDKIATEGAKQVKKNKKKGAVVGLSLIHI